MRTRNTWDGAAPQLGIPVVGVSGTLGVSGHTRHVLLGRESLLGPSPAGIRSRESAGGVLQPPLAGRDGPLFPGVIREARRRAAWRFWSYSIAVSMSQLLVRESCDDADQCFVRKSGCRMLKNYVFLACSAVVFCNGCQRKDQGSTHDSSTNHMALTQPAPTNTVVHRVPLLSGASDEDARSRISAKVIALEDRSLTSPTLETARRNVQGELLVLNEKRMEEIVINDQRFRDENAAAVIDITLGESLLCVTYAGDKGEFGTLGWDVLIDPQDGTVTAVCPVFFPATSQPQGRGTELVPVVPGS